MPTGHTMQLSDEVAPVIISAGRTSPGHCGALIAVVSCGTFKAFIVTSHVVVGTSRAVHRHCAAFGACSADRAFPALSSATEIIEGSSWAYLRVLGPLLAVIADGTDHTL